MDENAGGKLSVNDMAEFYRSNFLLDHTWDMYVLQ